HQIGRAALSNPGDPGIGFHQDDQVALVHPPLVAGIGRIVELDRGDNGRGEGRFGTLQPGWCTSGQRGGGESRSARPNHLRQNPCRQRFGEGSPAHARSAFVLHRPSPDEVTCDATTSTGTAPTTATSSGSGRFRNQFASADPVTFIQELKIAGARPTVATRPISWASPEASPPFCIPTSMEI